MKNKKLDFRLLQFLSNFSELSHKNNTKRQRSVSMLFPFFEIDNLKSGNGVRRLSKQKNAVFEERKRIF